MAHVPTAEALKQAREARALAKTTYDSVAAKLGTDEWNEEKDGPALETEKRNWEAAQTLVDRLTDKLAVESRQLDGGGASDNGRTPGVTILPEGRLGDNPAQVRREFRLLKALDGVVNNNGSMKGLEAEMDQEGRKEARDMKMQVKGEISIPSWLISSGRSSIEQREAQERYAQNRGVNIERRDILAETNTAGGHLVQTDVGGLIPVLEPRLQVESLGATKLLGLVGDLDLPRNDAYGSAAWEGEIDDAAETQGTFDKVSLAPERLAAFTQVSRQSIIQAKNVDVENFVRRDLTRAVRRALDLAAINGSGSGDQPTGILNVAGVNDITIGTNGGPLTWALVVQFETETANDDADFGRLAYLTTPGVAGFLKTTKRDVAGNGFIWEGPNMGSGNINGYTARVTTQMPSTLSKGASGSILHGMIFGNWEELIIAQWGGIDLIVDPYTLKNKGMIELTVNSYWDIALMHLASFCICNEIDIS